MIQFHNSIPRDRHPFPAVFPGPPPGPPDAASRYMDDRDERLYLMLTSLGLPVRAAQEHVVVLNLTGVLRDCGVLPAGAALTRLGLAVLDGQRRQTMGEYS